MARLIGYARVSTNGQTLDFQVEILEAAGAEMTFQETASGARTDRAQLAKAIGVLRAGDTLIVTRLDRGGVGPTTGRSRRESASARLQNDRTGPVVGQLLDSSIKRPHALSPQFFFDVGARDEGAAPRRHSHLQGARHWPGERVSGVGSRSMTRDESSSRRPGPSRGLIRRVDGGLYGRSANR
jgi:hypothetical protein